MNRTGLIRFGSAIGLLALSLARPADGATCSCAGAPLLSFIDTGAVQRGQLFVSFAAELHEIGDLVSGSRNVPDETGRDRSSVSQVLSASYAITDRWAVSALVSWIEHRRTIETSLFGETRTSGLSDSVVLLRYTPVAITPFSRHQLSVGAGFRLPTGKDDVAGGFVASEDMQPGSGARGDIAWASFSYAFNQAATLQAQLSASYTRNEENDRHYAFGDELTWAASFSHTVGTRFSYSAGLRYRKTRADERFGFAVPNTGGQWVDFTPAIRYQASDRLSLGLAGRFPLTRRLKGALQFTTSHSISLSASYAIR